MRCFSFSRLAASCKACLHQTLRSHPPRSDASGDRLRSFARAALIPLAVAASAGAALAFDPFRLTASSSLCDPGLDLRCSALSLSLVLSSPTLFRIDVTVLCLNQPRRER